MVHTGISQFNCTLEFRVKRQDTEAQANIQLSRLSHTNCSALGFFLGYEDSTYVLFIQLKIPIDPVKTCKAF